MQKSILTLLLCLTGLTTAFSQSRSLVMSTRGIGFIAPEKNQYFKEVKIDFDSNLVYYRESISKRYKEYNSPDNEKYIKFFKDSASIETIDSLVRSHSFRNDEGFMFQFVESPEYYYPQFIQSYEFGYPKEPDDYLDKILSVFQELQAQIVASEKLEKKKKKEK